jgi:hypothetical protein
MVRVGDLTHWKATQGVTLSKVVDSVEALVTGRNLELEQSCCKIKLGKLVCGLDSREDICPRVKPHWWSRIEGVNGEISTMNLAAPSGLPMRKHL